MKPLPKDRLPPLRENIRAFYGEMAKEHHRYRSWEHCFGYFQARTHKSLKQDRKTAALHLGFYLASWGMYPPSGFLLQHTFTIQLAVIDALASPALSPLWRAEFGAGEADDELTPIVLNAKNAVRQAYEPFAASDTLASKVLLRTLGCLPACDRFFIGGFKVTGLSYSRINKNFIHRLLEFTHGNLPSLRAEQTRIESHSGVHYPLMKLVDMYFWQLGYGRGNHP